MYFSTFTQFLHKIKSNSTPKVSVLIPAYNAREFICETLDSLYHQTFKDFEILVSVDKSDDDTGSIVEQWCTIHKKIPTTIFYQKYRLGWVNNINFLLQQCKTKYFMMLPHDDLIHTLYLQKMFKCMKKNPSASIVFSDIQGFGTQNPYIAQNSILGNKVERLHDFLMHHHSAVAIRGLANREILSDFVLLRENNYHNVSVDSIWNMQMVLMGEMIRIPEVLYYKRYHDDSAHAKWWKWEKEETIKAWLEHCTDCLKLISMEKFTQEELSGLIESIKSRLEDVHFICPSRDLLSLNEKEKASLIKSFEKIVSDLHKSTNNHISIESYTTNP